MGFVDVLEVVRVEVLKNHVPEGPKGFLFAFENSLVVHSPVSTVAVGGVGVTCAGAFHVAMVYFVQGVEVSGIGRN